MILADKIIELRKRNGWSQEELADKLDVSRQSVSKWEGAQSVPDMNKILKLSEVFGVSTDYLLKDELSSPEWTGEVPTEVDADVVRVSMEEASSFLDFKNLSATRVSLGVMLCIFSPILLIVLGAIQEAGLTALTETQVGGIGVIVLLLLIGAAVALFVLTGLQGHRYEYFEKSPIDTEYGVDGMAREKRERFRPTYQKQLTLGIVLCVLAVLPLFAVIILTNGENVAAQGAAIGLLLFIVGIGVLLIVRSSILWGALQMLLEEGEYSRRNKEEERRLDPIAGIYWCLVVAIYLGYSFYTNRWDRSWIVWPVAGVLYGAIAAIMRVVRTKA